MFRLTMLLAGLGGLLVRALGSQNSSLQIVFPEKIQANTSDNSQVENKQISYIIPIDEKPYTVHLKQRFFLAANFMVYLFNEGVTSHSSNIQTQCYYGGYIEGYPNSIVTLSTCSGLRGLLQFENVSYGIEPLDTEVEFQHLLYKLKNKDNEFAVHSENDSGVGQKPMEYSIFISEKSESALPDLIPLYLEMHIVVDKVLDYRALSGSQIEGQSQYDFLGSDSMMVTNKVIEIISLVNSVFSQFKVTIVLSSLELWSNKNKISTVGEAEELLQRFLEWKKSYLTLRHHDIAYLFIYRDYPNYVGATFPGQMCVTHHSAGIALYSAEITLEAFSVIVTQMLGLSLGISYDNPEKCQCSGAICIMNPEAMQYSGVKIFSSCSLSDFKIFISNMGVKCLQNKPQMQAASAAICGNGKVESPEICDCGTEQQCGPSSCCDPKTCVLKQGSQCDKGLCCLNCKFKVAGSLCRPAAHRDCDIPESCNGSSGACAPDVTILNGRLCDDRKYICYNGNCQNVNARCTSIFGKGSQSAPGSCYQEMHSLLDRFGNCGPFRGPYSFCTWRNIRCGRLVCTYPTRTPFKGDNISVLYFYVRNVRCVSLDYTLHSSPTDPLIIQDGSDCDRGRVCVNHQCVDSSPIKTTYRHCTNKCSDNGICTSLFECYCDDGWTGADCNTSTREAYIEIPGLITERDFWSSKRNRWLLGFYIAVPVLAIATVIAISWNHMKKLFNKEEESLSSESEGSIHTHTNRSRSESISQTDIVISKSEETT